MRTHWGAGQLDHHARDGGIRIGEILVELQKQVGGGRGSAASLGDRTCINIFSVAEEHGPLQIYIL